MPTLKFMLKTKKIILTTAHSELDSCRDLKLWKEIIHDVLQEDDENGGVDDGNENGGVDRKSRDNGDTMTKTAIHSLKYEINPFASRMSYQDPFPPKDFKNGEFHNVNPNHSVLKIDTTKLKID